MRAAVLTIAVLLAGCDTPPDVTFSDAAITLPDEPLELPPGPGMAALAENCTACHSPSMMFQQPPLPRDKWEGIVTKMIEVYKAPVDPAAAPRIVDYLMARQAAQAEAGAGQPDAK